jgi:membrane protein DedA with SNARE-associated domain
MLLPLDLSFLPHPHEPVVQRVTEYLERQSYFGVFFLLFLGAFGPSPPEEVILLIAGFLVFRGVARFPLMIGAELGGILISDLILYGFGRLFGEGLERRRFLKKVFPPERVRKIKEKFHRYRYRFIFLARYLYGLRPVVFFTAGASKMKILPFAVCDLGASLINCLVWTALGLLFGGRIEDVIRFSRRWEGILLGVAATLILYFVSEGFLVRKGIVSSRSFWIRQATGTKIAAVVATVLLAVLVGRFLFPHGVREGLHLVR